MQDAIEHLNEFSGLISQDIYRDERERAERDSDYFAEHFTRWPREAFHKAWARHMRSCGPGEIRMLLAPREHAKTQQITANETAIASLANPDFRTAIVSDTSDMAKRMGRRIKSILTSDKVRSRWGDVRGDKWSDTEMTLSGSTLDEKEATITILSAGGPVTSGHYERVILDDVVDLENSRTQLQRDKTFEWFKMTLIPVVARGQLWVIGTRYHFDDLYGRLLDPAHWKTGVKMLRSKAIGDDGAALWESYYPLELLEKLRANLGPVEFNAQYQNDVEAMKGSVFKAEWFKRYKKLPAGLRKYQGYDLAISDKEFANKFAGATVGVDQKSGKIYVVSEFQGRLTFKQQEEKVKELFELHDRGRSPVMRVGIESNQYQAALAQNIRVSSMVPVKAVHTHKDKMTRALRAQPHFENGKVFFPMEGTERLEEQLLRFGPDMKDAKDIDLMDAFLIALETAGKAGKRGARRTHKPRGM